MANVSVIILTLNEELNLPAALDSVKGWAQEVFVVDSLSTDRTVEIAEESKADGVQVVLHAFEDYSKQWNWALENLPLAGEWTLKLDADERVPEDFKLEANRLFESAASNLDGVYFRRKVRFLGGWLNWGLTRNNYDLRLWKTGRAVFEDRPVNEHVLVQGDTTEMSSFVNHEDFKDLAEWVDKQNRYTSMEAVCQIKGQLLGGVKPRFFGKADERRMWLRRVYFRLPFRPILFFFYAYFFKAGFLDGKPGFNYALLQAVNLHILDLKVTESRSLSK